MKASVNGVTNVTASSVIASSVNTLSAKGRKQGKADAAAFTLGSLMAEVGDRIALRDVDEALGKGETIEAVEALLRQMIAAGLNCDKDTGDMLKAPKAGFPGELWVVFVNAVNAPRVAANLPEVSVKTRNNYLTRIRAFVRARGAEPLDLYGNIQAARLAAAKTPLASEDSDDSDESSEADVTSSTTTPVAAASHVESLVGISPMLAFLSKWLEQNPITDDMPEGSAIAHIVGGAKDLLNDVQEAFKAESQVKVNGKGKGK